MSDRKAILWAQIGCVAKADAYAILHAWPPPTEEERDEGWRLWALGDELFDRSNALGLRACGKDALFGGADVTPPAMPRLPVRCVATRRAS
jgi:hypothetical protein